MMSGRPRASIDEWNADKWFREFFADCLLPNEDAESYAVLFAQNGMRSDMLPLLNKDLLKEMKITKVGHIIEILRAAQEVSSQEQRSGINHSSKPNPTVQSKVVSLKSVVSTKNSRQRKESEVGGAKRDTSGVKRPVPDEGPTLSVKMPNKIRQIPLNSQEEMAPSIVRPAPKERSGAQSVEVSSSSEKPKKKSVFERLGSASTPQTLEGQTPALPTTIQTSPSGGILKRKPSNQDVKAAAFYGPVELPKPITPTEPRRTQSPGRLVLNNTNVRSLRPNSAQVPRGNRSSSPLRQKSLSPGPSSKPSIEPSFHVTMSMKLSNPLVTKVNGPLNKRQEERRNFSTSVSSFNRSNSTPLSSEKQYYGSMAADQIQMSKDYGGDRDLKQRLGNKGSSWNKMESTGEKKRVSFGNVCTKEIPAVPGTQPFNPNQTLLCKQIYTGSVAFRTAKKL